MAGNQTVAEYRWLADGTKAGVKGYNDGTLSGGFEYLGSLIYRRDAGGGLQLESTGFGGGRFVASERASGVVYTPNYFITDHLGSTRVIVSHSGEVLDRSDYYAYGLKWEHPGAQASGNRWLYNGNELQTVGFPDGTHFLDYGVRIYDPRLGRFGNPDPLAGLMAGSTPYGYCLGNPVRYIDFLGMAPQGPDTIDGGELPIIYIDTNQSNGWREYSDTFLESMKERFDVKPLEKKWEGNANPGAPVSESPAREWEYYVPVWGSALMANNSWQNKQYFDMAGWFLMGVGEGLSFGILTWKR